MGKMGCGVVCDLLLSYTEGIVSDTTAQMIEEHLKECTECQKALEKRKKCWEGKELLEHEKGKRFQNKLLSYRYQVLGFFIGLCLPIAFLLVMWLLSNVQIYISSWFFG